MINELIQEKTLRVKVICLDKENWKQVHEFLNGSAPSDWQIREAEGYGSVYHAATEITIPFESYILLLDTSTYVVISKEQYDAAAI
jgi:hypothetical protein